MMVIAFWNIDNNTDIASLLIDFVKEQSIDVLLLAESDQNLQNKKRKCVVDDIILDFIIKSKRLLNRTYNVVPNGDFRIKVLTSYSPKCFSLKRKNITSTRWTAFSIKIPGKIKLNLLPVHFSSKVNWSEISLALECANFSTDINYIEKSTKCLNTILIGDFNMSPFENGVVASNGINALQDLNYLKDNLKGRDVDGRFYKYFYNPMWNFFGDTNIPYGTLYYRVSGHVSHEWHMYDQIMLRPELHSYIDNTSVSIVTNISGQSLLKAYNRPEERYSDHLPIVLKLKI